MKHYIKPIIGSIVIVASFATGAVLARPNDPLAELSQEERETEALLIDIRKEKCALIREHGGVCDNAEFGRKITEALADFH